MTKNDSKRVSPLSGLLDRSALRRAAHKPKRNFMKLLDGGKWE